MYNEYFGLEHTPFRLTPDTRLFYPGGGRGEVLDALIYAITSGEGIIKVVGEVGTGKTMLCRMLEERLSDAVEIVYLANPSLTPEDILYAIALELGLEPGAGDSRIQIMHGLQQALLERHAGNRRVVALVEEAQSMPRDTLEEIRLLSNLETKREKLLQIVLFGQPELDENLAAPEIRQLRERITHGFNLKALNTDEIREYMEFRLRASGYRGREAFSNKAYKVMHKASEGLTRRVNILADKSLLAAFAEDTHDVSERHVKVAIEDTQLSVPRRRGSSSWLLLAGGFGLAAVVGWSAATWYVNGRPGARPQQAMTASGQAAIAAATEITPATAPGITPEPTSAGKQPAPDSQPAAATTANESSRQQAGDSAAIVNPKVNPKAGLQAAVVAPAAATSSAQLEVQTEGVSAPAPATVNDSASAATPASLPAQQIAAPQQPQSAVPEPAKLEVLAGSPESGARQPARAPPPVNQPARSASPGTQNAQFATATGVAPGAPDKTPDQAIATSKLVAKSQVEPAAGPSRPTAPRDILDERLARTRDWLQQVNPRHYSIQLLATSATRYRNLRNFLQRRARSGQIQDLYVYETTIDKRPWYGVLYGEFSEFSKAQQALRKLPGSMTRHKPFIRNISDITARL